MTLALVTMLKDIATLTQAACPNVDVQIGTGANVQSPPVLHERGLIMVHFEARGQGRQRGLGSTMRQETAHVSVQFLMRTEDQDIMLPPDEIDAVRQSLSNARPGVEIRGCLSFDIKEERVIGTFGEITQWGLSCEAETLRGASVQDSEIPILKIIDFARGSQVEAQEPDVSKTKMHDTEEVAA